MGWPVVLDPIALYRGDSRTFDFRFWTDAARTVSADLTGFGSVFTGNLRRAADTDLLEALDIDASNAVGGQLLVDLTPASWDALSTTLSLGFDVGWDIQVETPDGTQVTTLLASRFTVTPDYTHA